MVRTQIQLTEEQSRILKDIAGEKGLSVAELIRQSIDHYIQSTHELTKEEKKRRALSVVGITSSGVPDLGSEHDRYLAEIYGDFGK